MSSRPIRALVLTNILPPYRVPLYRCLREDHGIDVTTVLLAVSEANRRWEPNTSLPFVRVLPGRSFFVWRWDLPIHLNYGLMPLLRSVQPDVVVVGGWDHLAYFAATWWAYRSRIPLVLQNESSLDSAAHMTGGWLWLKCRMVKAATAYAAYGSKAKEYLIRLGADPSRISVGLNTVDVQQFAREATRWLETEPTRARGPELRVLYVGQLIPRKAVDVLLRAVSCLPRSDVVLRIVGSGPLEDQLKALARDSGMTNVWWEGFKQPHELSKYYAWADVLVLPSRREVWGLVTNEALASGLYVVCSDKVGAGYDVIKRGWNGEIFASGDPTALSIRLREALSHIHAIRDRRQNIMADALERLSINQEADALASAIRLAARAQNDTT